MKLSFPWRRETALKMVWQVKKDGRCSFLVGTAHFFPDSFARSLEKLLERTEMILTEGPLDAVSMQMIADHGRSSNGSINLAEYLEPETVREIERMLADRLAGPEEKDIYLFVPAARPNYFDAFVRDTRPWMAMFSIWSTYLGWDYSVDMEAYQLALRMGMRIGCIETLEEQLEVLDSIPIERVLRHLNDVKSWKTYRDHYVKYYREGNLERLVALTDRFPTRTPAAIGKRDRIMFERMEPVMQKSPTAAFVGFPHVPGIRQLFLEKGYRVTQGLE